MVAAVALSSSYSGIYWIFKTTGLREDMYLLEYVTLGIFAGGWQKPNHTDFAARICRQILAGQLSNVLRKLLLFHF